MMATSAWRHLPNALTFVRILLVPVFGWVLLSHPHEWEWRLAAAAVFVLAMATDMADGRIARRYGLVTNFGKLADPIADKAMTGIALIGLSIIGEMWWWVTIVILVREWGITILREFMRSTVVMAANTGGKAKTVAQSVAITLLTLPPTPVPQWPGWVIMGIALILTVTTGWAYVAEAIRIRRTAA